jgi:hypothetical protein
MSMSRLVSAMAAVAVLSMGVALAAQDDLSKLLAPTSQDDLARLAPIPGTVTFNLRSTTLPAAIHVLGETAGIDIRLTPDVEALDGTVNFSFQNARFDDVFQVFLQVGHLSYAVINEKTVVVTRRP